MNDSDLKPCPFCGGKGLLWPSYPSGWQVGCANDNCEVQCWVSSRKDEAAAAAVWNRRAALTIREGELLAGGPVNLLDQQHSGVVVAQVLDVVPSTAFGADEAAAIGVGGQGDHAVGVELAEVASEHEVGVPAGSDSGMTASLTPPEGYVPEKPVLAAATQLRRLASAASPLARKAYIKAAETVEMAVSAARPEVSP